MTDPQETPSTESQASNSERHGVSAGQAPGDGTHILTDRDLATLLGARNCLDRLVELAMSLEAINATMNLTLRPSQGPLLSAARSAREDVRNLLRRLADEELERTGGERLIQRNDPELRVLITEPVPAGSVLGVKTRTGEWRIVP